MWRDRWFALAVIGAALSCLGCLTPVAVLALGAIGLGAWSGHLDVILMPVLVAFVVLAAYRWRAACRRTP
ncbi:MAG: mercury resistance system transport protein MerF [Candidatus Rokubacteria bacterium]|nr:mercury resistance system transport protein MerF [Candidatus Rokubacteria bacterium]